MTYLKILSLSVIVSLSFVSSAIAQDSNPEAHILITNALIFNGKDAVSEEKLSVLIKGNKITKIGMSIPATEGFTVIDAKGKLLMPGLIEGHAHVMMATEPFSMIITQDAFEQGARSAARAKAYFDAGFTTLRDMGGNCFGVKKAIDAGVTPGPRIFCGGASIGQTSGHGDGRLPTDGHPRFDGSEFGGQANRLRLTLIADGVDEVRAAVREQLFRGASHIKIHAGGGVTSLTDPLEAAQYTPQELAAAVEEATRYGTYVATHAQLDNSVVASINAGVKSIEHGLVLNESTVKKMAKMGIYYSPQAFLPLQDVSGNPQFQKPAQQAKLKVVANGAREAFRLAKKHKVKILWGTDVFGGNEIFKNFTQEFIYRDEFFTPLEQMQQVTGNNGEVLALSGIKNPYPDGELGVISEGAYADLILVNGDPSQDIRLLTNAKKYIDLIMKDGIIYKNRIH